MLLNASFEKVFQWKRQIRINSKVSTTIPLKIIAHQKPYISKLAINMRIYDEGRAIAKYPMAKITHAYFCIPLENKKVIVLYVFI
jgi:hypothetical protein